MRKSPQSKKPLHLDFSAPPICLAGERKADRFEAKLTALRGVHKMPSGAGSQDVFFEGSPFPVRSIVEARTSVPSEGWTEISEEI
jgi:hypothetical protein